jgi:hypothetical protein
MMTTPSLAQKIVGADKLGEQLDLLLNNRSYVIKTERDEMCLLYWSLIGDHHRGIMLLLQHENYPPAFALMRPIVEAFLRLHVTIHGTEGQLAALKNGTYQTEFVNIGRLIDETYQSEPLLGPWLKDSASILHDFTHGGLEQLLRHKSGSDIRPNFPESEVLQVVTLTTLIAFLTVLAVTEFLGLTAEFTSAIRLFDTYSQTYRATKAASA